MHNAQLAQLYNTFSTHFASYINSNNIGTNPPSLEDQEVQDINPYIYNLHVMFSGQHIHWLEGFFEEFGTDLV